MGIAAGEHHKDNLRFVREKGLNNNSVSDFWHKAGILAGRRLIDNIDSGWE